MENWGLITLTDQLDFHLGFQPSATLMSAFVTVVHEVLADPERLEGSGRT